MSQLRKVLEDAIADFLAHGYDNQARVDHWLKQIRQALRTSLPSDAQTVKKLTTLFQGLFQREVMKGRVLKQHAGLSRLTLEQLQPRLRYELERRIQTSANLIKLNRERMVQDTLQRFTGWSSSVPAGGTRALKPSEAKEELLKPFGRLPFEERRVYIDQGHKLISDVNDLLAEQGGAIAAEWHSHYLQPGYNYRVDHKERAGKIYLIRNSWAHAQGLVKPAKDAGYTDQITRPGEEVYCRCSYVYRYNLRDLPAEMLTKKGQDKLAQVQSARS